MDASGSPRDRTAPPVAHSAGNGTPRRAGRLRRGLLFVLNFLKHPRMVGTFAVSSPALVQRLLRDVDWSACRTIVELGPGVGTITEAILRRMPADARLLAIETNLDFVAELRRTLADPRLTVVHGSAAELHRHVEAGRGVDLVVSGIPFSTMPPPVREAVLSEVDAALSPHGRFLVYQYSGRVLPLLRRRFRVLAREVEWRNLVPMRLFRCAPLPLAGTGD